MGSKPPQEGVEPSTGEAPSRGPGSVTLRVGEEQLPGFFPLLQRGVVVRAEVGCSLKELLCGQIGIPVDYLTGRITTIFVNNSPVDRLNCTVVEGARIALSAAMPGLVGAVMRRSGFYAALRQGITHTDSEPAVGKSSTVTIKLFNLLLPEIGPLILARGVLLEPAELRELLKTFPAPLVAGEPPPGCREPLMVYVRLSELK